MYRWKVVLIYFFRNFYYLKKFKNSGAKNKFFPRIRFWFEKFGEFINLKEVLRESLFLCEILRTHVLELETYLLVINRL